MSEQESIGRREALGRMMLGAAGLSFLNGGAALAQAAAKAAAKPGNNSKAKAVIQVWLWGGPPHTDTFDPKPNAGQDYTGPLTRAIATKANGMQIGELLPLLAAQGDKYSLIRSMTHGNNGHETAAYMVQTGRNGTEEDRLVYPCAGAVVALMKGYDVGYSGLIPPYIVLTRPQGRFDEAGFLGPRYKPFATGGDPAQRRFVVDGVVSDAINDDRQKNRRALLHNLDTLGQAMPTSPTFSRADQCESKAYDLILGEGVKLFDLSKEKDDLRDKYGRSTFGQSCLMARRLVESGVPYVTINHGGWDTHKQHFEIMRQKLPELDRGLSTLLLDLADRGLLDSTIVWCCGEFGRTPKVAWEAPWNGGRHHFGPVFSCLVAGGGFKGGQVVGSSDDKGMTVATRPVYPQDLLGSMYQLLGFDVDGIMRNPRGLEVGFVDKSKGPGRLKEIM